MIFEVCREIDAYLKAHKCPVDVVYGPETTKPTSWGRERVVIENDGSDKFPGTRSQSLNPPLTTVRVQSLKATIYTRSAASGSQLFEHRRRADLILDQLLCAIRYVACTRKNGYDFTGGEFIVPEDMARSDVHGGAAYELKFTIERGVTEANFKGEISPEASGWHISTVHACVGPQVGDASPPRVLLAVGLDLGDSLGGDTVVLTGTGFTGTVAGDVLFGSTPAASITVNSSTQITAVTPAHAAGLVGVSVGGSTIANAFEFWGPNQITGVELFLDAARGVTSDGLSPDKVGDWADQIPVLPAARSATQTTAGLKPYKIANAFGSRPGIDSDATRVLNNGFSVAFTTGDGGFSVFWVAKWTSSKASAAGSFSVPLSVAANSGGYSGMGASGGALAMFGYPTPIVTRGSGLNDGVTRLCGWTFSAAGVAKAYVGTTQQGTDAAATFVSGQSGYRGAFHSYSGLDGFIGTTAAIIGVRGIISAGDLSKLHRWARARWGAAP